MFKEAIVECVQLERSRTSELVQQGATSTQRVPTFNVVGFASVSPMQWSDHDGAVVNCDVANRRADAVGSFLADEEKYKNKWECDAVGSNSDRHENSASAR